VKGHTTRKLTFTKADLSIDPGVTHHFEYNLTRDHIGGKAVLDLGCWNGKYLNLAQAQSPRLLVGVDLEERALKVGKEQVPNGEFISGSIYNLPFMEQGFDIVVLWGVFEHLPVRQEPAALGEINRVLKKGGKFFLMTPYSHFLANLMDPAYWLVGHRHYNKRGITRLLNDAGFEVERFQVKGGMFEALETLAFYVSKHIFRRAEPPSISPAMSSGPGKVTSSDVP